MNKEYIKNLKSILKSTKNQVQKNRVRLAILNITGNKDADSKRKVKKSDIKKHKRVGDNKAGKDKKKSDKHIGKEKGNITKKSKATSSSRNSFFKGKKESKKEVNKLEVNI